MNLERYLETYPDVIINIDSNVNSIIMKKASDKWFPNFPGNYVCMKFIKDLNKTIISIHGEDKFMMYKVYQLTKDAKVDYHKLFNVKAINQGMLYAMGFESNIKEI